MVLSVRNFFDCEAQCIWNFYRKKFELLKCQQLLFRFGIVYLNLPMQSADRYNLHGENSIYFDCFERHLMLRLVFKTPKRKESLRLMSYKF